jgi:hypothetical protein
MISTRWLARPPCGAAGAGRGEGGWGGREPAGGERAQVSGHEERKVSNTTGRLSLAGCHYTAQHVCLVYGLQVPAAWMYIRPPPQAWPMPTAPYPLLHHPASAPPLPSHTHTHTLAHPSHASHPRGVAAEAQQGGSNGADGDAHVQPGQEGALIGQEGLGLDADERGALGVRGGWVGDAAVGGNGARGGRGGPHARDTGGGQVATQCGS